MYKVKWDFFEFLSSNVKQNICFFFSSSCKRKNEQYYEFDRLNYPRRHFLNRNARYITELFIRQDLLFKDIL